MYKKVFIKHAQLLKALANPKRLEVIQLLRQGKLQVSEMERMLDLPQANLSQHLMILRRWGVVRAQRKGKEMYYSLTHRNFAQASDLLREVLIERLGGRVAVAARALDVVVDPVCQMRLTPRSAAGSLKRGNKTYYFCGSGCERSFRKVKT